jgi:hypothetical protein
MNGQQSWIRIEDYELAVSGGEAACLYFLPGSYELTVTSTFFGESRSRNTKACKSKTQTIQLAEDEDRAFSVEPAKSKDGEWKCGWLIHSTGGSHHPPRKDHP